MSLAFSPDHLSCALDGAQGGAPPERSWWGGWSAACEGLERQRSFLALVPAQLRAWDAWDRDADKNVHPSCMVPPDPGPVVAVGGDQRPAECFFFF